MSQLYTDFKVIVVDDGSTDASKSIVESLKDKRVRVISQENGGVSAARNRGVIESVSQWIAFLDADNFWTEDHLDEVNYLIKKFYNVGIISTQSVEIDTSKSRLSPDHRSFSKVNRKRWLFNFFRESPARKISINSSSVAVRRDVFDKVGFFKHLKSGEDTEFWARVCLVYPCVFSERETSFYCRGTGGIMEQLWEKNVILT